MSLLLVVSQLFLQRQLALVILEQLPLLSEEFQLLLLVIILTLLARQLLMRIHHFHLQHLLNLLEVVAFQIHFIVLLQVTQLDFCFSHVPTWL